MNRIDFFQSLLALFTFFLISFLALTEINIVRWKQSTILHFSLQLFHYKHCRCRCRSRWENLDRGQYPFQPIKVVNLVVPSPCETEPYNYVSYKLEGGNSHTKRTNSALVEILNRTPKSTQILLQGVAWIVFHRCFRIISCHMFFFFGSVS